MGYTLYHRHAHLGHLLACFVLLVGIQVLTCTVSPMALSEGQVDCWVMSSLRGYVHVIVVSLPLTPREHSILTQYRCWLNYFGIYLQVVNRLTVTQAGYVQGCYGLGAAVFNPFIGG